MVVDTSGAKPLCSLLMVINGAQLTCSLAGPNEAEWAMTDYWTGVDMGPEEDPLTRACGSPIQTVIIRI
ncbi:hypothetical protein U1Q18_018394 [Sarracenia purpurea var. burkii]